MSRPITHFAYCPQCSAPLTPAEVPNRIHCRRCAFRYYFNPAVSTAAFVLDAANRLLLLQRAKEPAQGKWTLPGGFVDFEETVENALCRETMEEVGIELADPTFLCSQVNQYAYQSVTYPVVDLFFLARARSLDARPLDGTTAVCWVPPEEVDLADLAFVSVRAAWPMFLDRLPRAGISPADSS